MDGAMLFNATYFDNTTDGMLISSIVNAGSKNNNVDAEIQGFEGNMVWFLSETTRLDATWLFVNSEIKDFSLIDPINITIMIGCFAVAGYVIFNNYITNHT